MPTTPAAESAAAESAIWADVHERWLRYRGEEVWRDVAATETEVVPEVDPRGDLERRARQWGYPLAQADLPDLARFAAALALVEAEGWDSDDGVLATQAYEARRFLAADRILPWAVPWLIGVARCYPETRVDATVTAEALLELGDRHRPAPVLVGGEGLGLPGYDGYGPMDEPAELLDRMCSLWGGIVVFRRSVSSMVGAEVERRRDAVRWLSNDWFRGNLVTWYEVAGVRWDRLVESHPGTARYWTDLAQRAAGTAQSAK